MPLILGSNAPAAGGYEVDNSLRFDDDSTDYLNRTPATTTNRKTFTISFWIKSSTAGGTMFSTGDYAAGDGYFRVRLSTSGRLALDDFEQGGNGYNVRWVTNSGTGIFTDPSAWYNMVMSIDSTQATLSDRVNFYLNGENIDSLFVDNSIGDPVLNADFHVNNNKVHQIGRDQNNTDYFDGYIAEFVLIDGQQLDATSFGEFDEDSGIWKPIDVSGLTFGTNGFYLPFENSAALGQDDSGNGNNFTVNNLTSIDQTTDTPTNNFATLNPLVDTPSASWSEGNMKLTGSSSSAFNQTNFYTIGVSSGKWYTEVKYTTAGTFTYNPYVGIAPISSSGTVNLTGSVTDAVSIRMDNDLYVEGSSTSSYLGSTPSAGDIIQVALDMDNGKVWFGINGTFVGDPAAGTGEAFSGITSGETMAFGIRVGDAVLEINSGNPPFTISSGNSDGNGYGNFEYAVPSGYYALNTKNLAEYG